MQPVDLTTLRALLTDLKQTCLPARVETLQQLDLWTVCVCLRTLATRLWVLWSWHPQAARMHSCPPPPKGSDSFQFSQVLQRCLKGLAVSELRLVDPWERVVEWQFAPRPGDPPLWSLYLEIMGKYSNAVLVGSDGMIVAAGHGVSERQSSVRPVQPGLLYQLPPPLTETIPSLTESFDEWRERLAWLPGQIRQRLLKNYRGLSVTLVSAMLQQAVIPLDANTDELRPQQWQMLYGCWQDWLHCLTTGSFRPGWTEAGYSVVGWQLTRPAESIHRLLSDYYDQALGRMAFQQEHHHLSQKVGSLLKKLYQRRQQFDQMLAQSAQAETAKQAADLLMTYLHCWQPGLSEIALPDFTNNQHVRIALDPEKNAVINAQNYYKKHRKQKRAKDVVLPLWKAVDQEIHYLEQIETALADMQRDPDHQPLETLQAIRQELIQQGYEHHQVLGTKSALPAQENVRRFILNSGLEVWVGRNNLQNDWLISHAAQDQDWWFHAQEIPGSHVLLRLPPGAIADSEDLQGAADFAAHFSRARLSEQVPVVYTRPKHVYKPKGSRPGMVIYKHETVMWGKPNHPNILELLAEIKGKEEGKG